MRLFTMFIIFGLSFSLAIADTNYSIEEKNGVKEISNKNKASIENLNIEPVEIFSISALDSDNDENGVVDPSSYQVDSKGNIFIFDRSESKVVKFDDKGSFIKKFGNKGSGPGEYKAASNHMVVNDNIIFCDQRSRQLVFYDNEGTFIENVIPSQNFPTSLVSVGNDKYLGLTNYQEQRDGKPYFGFALTLIDKEYNTIKKLWFLESEITAHLASEIGDMVKQFPMQVVKNSKIYIAEKSKTDYSVKVFDFNGKLIEVIKKKYRRISRTKQEIRDARSGATVKMRAEDESGSTISENEEQVKDKDKYKDSILGINIDKEDRIWINSSKDSKKFDNESFSYYDIFSKEGFFLKTIKLNKEISAIQLIGDKLFSFYGEDNILKVYDY